MALGDYVLDNGLQALDTLCSHVYICNALPSTYAAATSTNALGNKNFGAGNAFGAPAAKSPNGRQVTSVAVTDGSVTADGTASHLAFVDAANSRLLHTQPLSATKAVNNGDVFTLNAITVGIPNQ